MKAKAKAKRQVLPLDQRDPRGRISLPRLPIVDLNQRRSPNGVACEDPANISPENAAKNSYYYKNRQFLLDRAKQLCLDKEYRKAQAQAPAPKV